MEAYDSQSACVAAVVKMLQGQKDENWSLPLMYTVCLDLRLVAQKAEECNRKFFLITGYLIYYLLTSHESAQNEIKQICFI